MAVSSQVPEFISSSLAVNNRSLLAQISKLVTDSAESVKRSSVEAADEQLCEIKKLRREEPKLPRLRKIWPLEVQMFTGFSFCFEICSEYQLGMDENRKFDVCFLDYPCDYPCDGSSNSFKFLLKADCGILSIIGNPWVLQI